MIKVATILSAKEVAMQLETDPRTFRKFMRDHLEKDAQPGKGHRYQIQANQVRSLKKAFLAWDANRTKPQEVDEAPEMIDAEEVTETE